MKKKRKETKSTFFDLDTLYTRAIRAIVNHTSTSEYHLRFFSREEFLCSCGLYPIKSR